MIGHVPLISPSQKSFAVLSILLQSVTLGALIEGKYSWVHCHKSQRTSSHFLLSEIHVLFRWVPSLPILPSETDVDFAQYQFVWVGVGLEMFTYIWSLHVTLFFAEIDPPSMENNMVDGGQLSHLISSLTESARGLSQQLSRQFSRKLSYDW